jgi:hypothetical protein
VDQTTNAFLQRLQDKQEIHESIMRYCRGVDRRDPDLIASAFHPDATDDHGSFTAVGDAIVPTILNMSAQHSVRSMHFIGNELIEINGDVGIVETYFLALLLTVRDGQELTRIRCGRHIDRFERRSGEWRIAKRIVVDELDRIDPVGETIAGRDSFHLGERSRDDPIFTMLDSMQSPPDR